MPMFITSDKGRPGFNLKMELLASLPREPRRVPLSVLVADLELRDQREATELIQDLRAEGFGVKCRARDTGGAGVMVCIDQDTWEKATAAAEEYWERVWEAETAGAEEELAVGNA